jgi:hypothetical protein
VRLYSFIKTFSWLDTLIAPLVSNRIKRSLSDTLEEYFKAKLNEANTQLNDWLSSRPMQQLMLKADETLKENYQKAQFQQKQTLLSAK